MPPSLAPREISLGFPEKLQFLFRPKRFKVMLGGRGAGRSWGVARALLLIGKQRSIRVLCVRELQNSIEESVHKVLSDQIEQMGLGAFYRIEKAHIYGSNGTSFSFEGIKNNTGKIRSYEGIDYCWVEEAVKVSKASWGVLTPTIRKETPLDWRDRGMEAPEFQAEIWMTFNPELKTDYTYVRWAKDRRLKPSPEYMGVQESSDSYVCKMTWFDNPWFPSVLAKEMLETRERDYDEYLHVWEGNTIEMLDGVVYAKELRRAQADGRICVVPYEPEVPVDCFWDLGRADHTCIWFAQWVAMQFRVIDFLDGQGEEITWYLKELQRKEYVYGTMHLPHDAKHKKLVYKHSIEQIVRGKFPSTRVLPKSGLVDGINAARLFFRKCWFDEDACADGLAALRRYKYKTNQMGLDDAGKPIILYSNEPLHDDAGASDAADAFRYMALSAGTPGGTSPGARVKERLDGLQESARASTRRLHETLGSVAGGLGWMR